MFKIVKKLNSDSSTFSVLSAFKHQVQCEDHFEESVFDYCDPVEDIEWCNCCGEHVNYCECDLEEW